VAWEDVSKKETLTLSAALVALFGTLPFVLVSGGPKPEVLEAEYGTEPAIARLDVEAMPPAAPGGAGVTTPLRRGAPDVALRAPELVVWCDSAAQTILGPILESSLRCRLERGRRREPIEHVITGRAGVGIVTTEPSENERRLGALDIVIGVFEPVCVVDPSSPIQTLSRDAAREILSGGLRDWRVLLGEVGVVGPGAGPRADLFAELLIPGDRLAVREVRASDAQVLKALRGRPQALGVVHRGVVSRDGSVRPIEIQGFRPSLEVRVVLRNERDPNCAALLQFWRSSVGRERLGRVMTVR
jgi:hypothetical protein